MSDAARSSLWFVAQAMARAPIRHLWRRAGTAVVLLALCIVLTFLVVLPLRDWLFVQGNAMYGRPWDTIATGRPPITVGNVVFAFLLDLSQRIGEVIVGVVVVWGWARALSGRSLYQSLPAHMFRDWSATRVASLLALVIVVEQVLGGAMGWAKHLALESAGGASTLAYLIGPLNILEWWLAAIATLGIWLAIVASINLGRWTSPLWGLRLSLRHPGITILASILIVLVELIASLLANQVTHLAFALLSPQGHGALSGTPLDILQSVRFGVVTLSLLLKTSILLVALHVMAPGLLASRSREVDETSKVFD